MIVLLVLAVVVVIIVLVVRAGRSSANSDSSQPASQQGESWADIGVEPPDERGSGPYLSFGGPLSADTPREFLPLLDTIRRESEWRRLLGGRVQCDRDGNYETISVDGYFYGLTPVIFPEKDEKEAIRTGKKLVYRPEDAADYVLNFSFSLDDFVGLGNDVAHYIDALRALEAGDHTQAIEHLSSAAKTKPHEHVYSDLLFSTKLEQGDTSGVDSAVAYYEDDMDSAVHSGQAKSWINALVAAKHYADALRLIERVDSLLEDLAAGRRQNKRFGGGDPEFAQYKREEFRRNLASAASFGSSKSILQENEPSEDLVQLFQRVIEWDRSSKSRILAERAGDVAKEWGDDARALAFYRDTLELLSQEDKPKVRERVEKKVAQLSR